jgi:putative hydrolase of the HAD superfamily
VRPESRAVVFDLDDTLYPCRRFALSGLAAAAAHAARARGLDRSRVFRFMARARRSEPGQELQAAALEFGLSSSFVDELVDVVRQHHPSMRLPGSLRRVLSALRNDRWRLAVLTNGPRSVQTRKIHALGLTGTFDAVVFATEHGSGCGKPESEPFLETLERIGVAPSRAVFVGDDEECDVRGARAAGMFAVRCRVWRRGTPDTAADAAVDTFAPLEAAARALVTGGTERHVA